MHVFGLRARLLILVLIAFLPSFVLLGLTAPDHWRVPLLLPALGAVGLLSIVIAWFFGSVFILRPIYALADLTKRLAGGDLKARAGSRRGTSELGQLAQAFDDMADALESRDQKLTEAERRFRALVEEVPAVIYEANLDGGVVYVSPPIERLLGFAVSRWEAGPAFRRDRLHPEDRERVMAEFGSAVRSSKSFVSEYRMVGADGRIVWCRDAASPVLGDDGRIRSVRGFITDITDRKRLEREFHQSQKMEAIGRLAGGVAHDFNNLLTVITGYNELAIRDLPVGNPLRPHLEEVRAASKRATALTGQLLAFSRKQETVFAIVDLNDAVRRTETMLHRLIGEDIQLVTAFSEESPRVMADVGQLEQIIMNLAVNARDAMPDGGTLTLETSYAEIDEEYARTHVDVKQGSYALLTVTDTGCGMDAQTLSRLFEPFFTTKEKGKGTGLGLSTVYGIVRQHEGHIRAYSEVGRGTTFKVYFPRVHQGITQKLPAPEGAHGSESGAETVLVVDDEEEIRRLIRQVLASKGYRVLEAEHAAGAKEVARGHAGRIDLLVVDLVMPGMGGVELARLLAAERGPLRVLYLSGFADRAVVDQGLLTRGQAFLQKPFMSEGLLRKVREALDGG